MSPHACGDITLTADNGLTLTTGGSATWNANTALEAIEHSGFSEERLREIVREEVLKALAELGTSVPGTIEL